MRTKGSCGYGNHIQIIRQGIIYNNISQNIRKLKLKQKVRGKNVDTFNYENFFKSSIALPSKYNAPKMRTLLTTIENTHYGICNVRFKQNNVYKLIQFIAVDGSSLTPYQYNDPDCVIDLVNQNKLPLIRSKGSYMTTVEMTNFDAYSGSIWFCLYLYELFGRVGIIDEENVVFLSVTNIKLSNAFWNGHYMTYGDGSESQYNAFTSLDIIGHEVSHGIIETSCALTYVGESGALNESIADIFGVCLMKYYDTKCSTHEFTWEIGSDICATLRSMAHPKVYKQPDTYNGKNWVDPLTQIDNGGVHINSGVGNFLFYLLCCGGKGKNDVGVKYDVKQSLSIFKINKLIYYSLIGCKNYKQISSNCNYFDYGRLLRNNSNLFTEEFELDNTIKHCIYDALIAINLADKDITRSSEPKNEDDQKNKTPSNKQFPNKQIVNKIITSPTKINLTLRKKQKNNLFVEIENNNNNIINEINKQTIFRLTNPNLTKLDDHILKQEKKDVQSLIKCVHDNNCEDKRINNFNPIKNKQESEQLIMKKSPEININQDEIVNICSSVKNKQNPEQLKLIRKFSEIKINKEEQINNFSPLKSIPVPIKENPEITTIQDEITDLKINFPTSLSTKEEMSVICQDDVDEVDDIVPYGEPMLGTPLLKFSEEKKVEYEKESLGSESFSLTIPFAFSPNISVFGKSYQFLNYLICMDGTSIMCYFNHVHKKHDNKKLSLELIAIYDQANIDIVIQLFGNADCESEIHNTMLPNENNEIKNFELPNTDYRFILIKLCVRGPIAGFDHITLKN